jgi:hypothetical protein
LLRRWTVRFVSRFVCLIAVSAALSGCGGAESNVNSASSKVDPDAAKAALGQMPAAPGKGGKVAPPKK